MVGMLKRMRHFKELLDIRLGPGAMVMAPDVQRIHLSFARKINDGHMGPRKFWREYLPRLKYHNPAVPMTVARSDDQAGPATLTIHFADLAAAAATSADTQAPTPARIVAAETARTETITMKHRHERDILADFTKIVSGQQVEATAEELEELEVLREQRVRSDRDAALQKEVLRKQRREQEILDQARRSVEAQKGGA